MNSKTLLIIILSLSDFIETSCFSAKHTSALSTRHSLSMATKEDSTIKLPTSLATVQEDYKANVMNTYGRYNLAISHGKGSLLFDTNGKEYIDFAAGISTCCLGHANQALKEAITKQLDKVHHCSNLYYIPEQAALAKWLVKNSCADKVFFCNSGAEANEAAIKLARKYAHTKLNINTPVIITAVSSFHGRTLTAITATGQPKYQKDFGPLTPGFEYVDYNDVEQLREKVKNINQREGQGVAAILMEALQGEGGIKPATKEYFQEIRKLCDETGALMMVDEVQTGMGRTGLLWGHEQLGVSPDVFTSAKAIGAGVPLGAMLCKDKFNVFGPGDHASTYGGNPLACSAGLTVAAAFEDGSLLQNVQERGEQLRNSIKKLQDKYPRVIKEVRGWGLINGMVLSDDEPITASDVTAKLMEAGVLVVPAGVKVVRFVPPLIITEKEVDEAMDKLASVLDDLIK